MMESSLSYAICRDEEIETPFGVIFADIERVKNIDQFDYILTNVDYAECKNLPADIIKQITNYLKNNTKEYEDY
jgi:hypothetical protein